MTNLATAQQNDSDLQNFLNSENLKLNVEMRSISDCDRNFIGDVSTGEFRPIVPNSFRENVFNIFHSLSRPGVRGSRNLISKRFVWPHMNTDIANLVRSCLQRHSTPMLVLNMSIVIGPLILSEGAAEL